MSRIAKFLNPRIAGGVRWWQIHAAVATSLLVAAVAVVAFSAGWFSGSRYTENYYRTHYKAPLAVPSLHVPVKIRATILPSSGSIHFTYFKTQINDQGQLGSCQSWAFVKQLSYAFNWNYPHHGRFYSPRFTYDAISQCADQGSYLEQYPPVVAAQGIPQWTQMPYGTAAEAMGLPDYVVDCPIGATYIQEAALHHLSLTEQPLYEYPGAGSGGLSLILQAISTHHAVNLDFPVYPEYDQANADGSTVNPPTSGETDRGGHANSGVLYDNNHDNGDGTHGAVLSSNQWGKSAGVGADGIRHTDGTPNGFVWLSYSFIEQYSFGVAVIHVSSSSTGAHQGHVSAPPVFVPSHAPTFKAPPIHGKPTALRPGAGALQVYGVKTWDTGVDISASINAAAARYGYSAPGYAALMGTESSFHQYAPHTPINGAGYCDYSGGLTQITVCTAAGLGVGNGTLSQSNIDYVFWYEQQDANRDVALSARLVDEFHQAVCWDWAPLAALYASWNLGPGYGCYAAIYRYPTNSITIRAVSNYIGWFNWVMAYHVRYGPPPKPKPHYTFPVGVYEHYRHAHHKTAIPYRVRGHLTWAASVWWTVQDQKGYEVCRGIKRPERWYAKIRVMRTDYQRCVIFTWPTRHDLRPKIVRR